MTNQIELNAASRPYLDDLAELYDEFIAVMDHPDSPSRAWLLSQLPGGGRALDIGCGNGRNCRLIADRYDEVVGVDISPRVLEIAESKDNPSNIHYECCAIQDLSLRTIGQFDAVFATNGVFSMGPAASVLPFFRRHIAPGGRLVVLDPTRPDSANGDDVIETRQSSYPFEVAHTIYQMSGDAEGAIAALRYMLHPTWQVMNNENVPLTLTEFEREYSAVFPGVQVTPNVVPTLSGAVWHAPQAAGSQESQGGAPR